MSDSTTTFVKSVRVDGRGLTLPAQILARFNNPGGGRLTMRLTVGER